MTNYQKRKEAARREAIEWQIYFTNNSVSYGELLSAQIYFELLAKRFGLLKEFRENGIC